MCNSGVSIDLSFKSTNGLNQQCLTVINLTLCILAKFLTWDLFLISLISQTVVSSKNNSSGGRKLCMHAHMCVCLPVCGTEDETEGLVEAKHTHHHRDALSVQKPTVFIEVLC